MTTKAREPVSEAACALILVAAVAASLLRGLLDGDPPRYLSYALLSVATPGAVAVLYYSVRRGAQSWSWVAVAVASVALGLADAFL